MKTVNLFFSCDDTYLPFLAVTLTSIRENRDKSRRYVVRILNTGLTPETRQRLQTLAEENFLLEPVDISLTVERFARQLHTRDYYSKSTYYRLFIPELFPELDKALYLDCDIVVTGDISRLFDRELGSDLVGAVPDSMVIAIKPLSQYARKRLQVRPENYFNAGVLLMNLEQMRKIRFTDTFLRLLQTVTFRVAQDQDYLNVLCKGRVTYLGFEWNTMPGSIRTDAPRLIHYNLDCKPWQRDDVAYSDVFWHYAKRSGFYQDILAIRAGFTPERIRRRALQTTDLIALGKRQSRQWTRNYLIQWQIKKAVNF